MADRGISNSSKTQYERTLTRAFGTASPDLRGLKIPSSVNAWPDSSKGILTAAIGHLGRVLGADTTEITKQIRRGKQRKTVPVIPTDEETARYVEAAKSLPVGIRSIMVLPVYLGLRAAEVVGLTRASVTRAAETGELFIVRKGDTEQVLKAGPYTALFQDMLLAPPKASIQDQMTVSPLVRRIRKWAVAGEVLSSGRPSAQYVAFWRRVHQVAKKAGIDAHPHLLRHFFATRMIRDGAPLPVVQKFLGHRQIATTMRYLHLDSSAALPFLRPVT
jgi:site-specific recombinase XerD